MLAMVMLALPVSLVRVADFGFRAANFAHIIGAVFILLVWFLRRRFSQRVLGIMMVAGLSFIAFPGLFSYGFASATTTFGVFAILLITIVWNKRYGMATFSVYVIFILFVAYGFTKGSLGGDFDFNAYLHSPTAWAAVFTGIIIQAYIFISAIGSYKDGVWALQKEVAYKSDHDFLTGLFNRQKIHEVLNDKIADESVSRFALFFMDLDGFKVVNDIYGHEVGDFVLQEIGRRLHRTIRRRLRGEVWW